MKKQMTIGYQNRTGRHHDLPPVPKLILANHLLKESGFSIDDKVEVEYSTNTITITKSNQHI